MNAQMNACQVNAELKDLYVGILRELNPDAFGPKLGGSGPDLGDSKDLYSGVFLPVAFDEYFCAPIRIMLVGMETKSWKPKGCAARPREVLEARRPNSQLDMKFIVDRSIDRYEDQYDESNGWWEGPLHCYQYRIVDALGLENKKAVIWSNLLAWSWNEGSPFARSKLEREEIIRISNKLLAAQIRTLKPEYIIFTTLGLDLVIKRLFNKYFGSYDRIYLKSKKLWIFRPKQASDITCYRIAHPAAGRSREDKEIYKLYRGKVLERIRKGVDKP